MKINDRVEWSGWSGWVGWELADCMIESDISEFQIGRKSWRASFVSWAYWLISFDFPPIHPPTRPPTPPLTPFCASAFQLRRFGRLDTVASAQKTTNESVNAALVFYI